MNITKKDMKILSKFDTELTKIKKDGYISFIPEKLAHLIDIYKEYSDVVDKGCCGAEVKWIQRLAFWYYEEKNK